MDFLLNHPIGQRLIQPIKVTSIILISAALGLELASLYHWLQTDSPIQGLTLVFTIERIALISHGIEGAIAMGYASAKGRSPWRYSLYTFFVGTIGLIELLNQPCSEKADKVQGNLPHAKE